MTTRTCIGCPEQLTACMGFQLARDTLANYEGKRATIRELCWKCAYKCSEAADPAYPNRLEALVYASEHM